ncbi:MAG: thiol-disulfide oxidoreductase DCC family protein [Planctomycetes bacterium]|nr:thiol-disulfide oxidoreductase DCC family protein [Planctomycetota bacterium]
MSERPDDPPVVLFDGVCNLCNGWVRFVLRHERSGANPLRFAALQSEAGARLLAEHGLPTDRLDSIVLIDGGRASQKSDAVLRLLRHLRQPWRLGAVFRIMPRFLRDAVYDLVARNRYRLFGRRDTCSIPTPETRARFLDAGPAPRSSGPAS